MSKPSPENVEKISDFLSDFREIEDRFLWDYECWLIGNVAGIERVQNEGECFAKLEWAKKRRLYG